MGEVILTMKGIDKSFPGVHALDHVDLEIRKGEVHALMGENGAGKSTLMKVLTGIYSKDSGTITYEGKEVTFSNPREAQDAGIVIVHQELNMMNHLTVAQNIFIGREFKKGIRIDDKLYGLPFRNDYYLLYYNKTLFDQAGVEYPKNDMTWDEYRELAKKMTSGEGNDKIYGGYCHTWPGSLYRWGLSEEHSMADGEYSFLKPVYELFLGMQNEDMSAMDYGTLKTGNVHYSGPFYKEQVAMELMGTWFANMIINTKNKGETSVEWGAVRAPHFEGQEPGTAVSNPTPIAINKNAAHPEEAWRFVEFMCTEPGANILAGLGTLPAYQNEKTIDTLVNVEGMPEGFREAIAADNFVLECQMIPQAGALEQIVAEEHDLIMLGANSIDDGLANMAKRVNDLLSK